MDLNQAKQKLNDCTRSELRDHSFSDREVYWMNEAGEDVAFGYFGRNSSVGIYTGEVHPEGYKLTFEFEGDEARALAECGTLKNVSRNDSTGPNNYSGA